MRLANCSLRASPSRTSASGSPNSFTSAAAGCPTPRALRTWCRLFVAGRLLEEPGRTVESIALQLEFDSTTGLRNALKRYTGHGASAIRAAGGEAVACNGDVTAEGFAERFVGAAVDTWGGLDIVVNNAGYTWDNVVQKMTDEQWFAILNVHLTAPFRILRAASGFIREAGRTLVMQADVSGRSLILVLLGASSSQARATDADRLRRWVLRSLFSSGPRPADAVSASERERSGLRQPS